MGGSEARQIRLFFYARRRFVVEDRTVFRVGAWAAIIGGILAVVVNVLAPRGAADDLGDPTAFLGVVATSSAWEVIQIGVVVALLIIVAGFYAVTKSVEDAPASAWASFGLGAAIIGTTIGVAAFAINSSLASGLDSVGTDAMASAAVISGGLFSVWVITYFGLTALLYGLALAASNEYPSWLGWVTVLAGLVGLVTGFMDAFAGATEVSTFVLFPISSGVLTLVIIYLGVLLLGKASANA
jgi:hypothetical protein